MTATPSLDCFVDPLVGIVVETAELLDHRASPRLHSAHVVVADPSLTAGTDVEFGGGGTGADPRQARSSAIGEAVERYSASYVDERRIIRCTQPALVAAGLAHVALDRLQLFTIGQLAEWRAGGHGYDGADPDTELAGSRGGP